MRTKDIGTGYEIWELTFSIERPDVRKGSLDCLWLRLMVFVGCTLQLLGE